MTTIKDATDADLIAEVLRRQLRNGRLVTPEHIWVGGIQHHAGAYTMAYAGPTAR